MESNETVFVRRFVETFNTKYGDLLSASDTRITMHYKTMDIYFQTVVVNNEVKKGKLLRVLCKDGLTTQDIFDAIDSIDWSKAK